MPTDTRRTKMIHVYQPFGGPNRLEVERETRRIYEDGQSLAVPGGALNVRRDFAAIEMKALPAGPVTVATYGDLQALLLRVGDELAAEDEAAIAAEEQHQAELRAAAINAEKDKLAALKPKSPNPKGTP